MMAHPHDDIESYALGGLEEDAARLVLAHADQCPTCAVLLAEAIRVASSLEPGGERPLSKPIALGDLAPARVVVPGPWSRLTRWTVPLTATAAMVALLVWNLNLRSAVVAVPIASLVHSHFAHHALHGSIGDAKVIQALDGRWLYLLADGLSPKTRYRLFETADGAKREVGAFMTTTSGQATGYWEQTPTQIQAFDVEPEAATSSPSGVLRWP